ncbi:MAG: hypothetical protein HW389_3559, partial [Bacteroidetes bacterium]|nr:hypothetical protein [Bacteroidota bacterium]
MKQILLFFSFVVPIAVIIAQDSS